MSTMTLDDTQAVCDLAKELCGIYLDHSKDYLIESRLREMRDRLGCDSYATLVRQARLTPALQTEIVNALTTNETLFFRDNSPFQALQHKALPELIDAKTGTIHARRIRIWSAACSTGQEAYSIAMTLSDLIPDIHSWDIKIIGSDVSDAAVQQASRGEYSPLEIERGLPPAQLHRYFFHEANGKWRVRDELRSLCSFERRNLTKPLLGMGPFDVVFCRNVAIYFTADDRRQMFERIAANMGEFGYLFVGSSESLSDLGPRFAPHRHCRSVFYRPSLRTAT